MGFCTVQSISLSKLPNAFPLLFKPFLFQRLTPLIPTAALLSRNVTPTAALLSRSILLRNLSPRATPSEERSSGASDFFSEKRDGVITVEDVKTDDKMVNEDRKEELPDEGLGLSFDLLDKFNITDCFRLPTHGKKFDTNDTGSIFLYGGGVLATLWLTSAVIGAIDSIPLFPKLLEVVGLAYTVWFTSRYLLFKQNRDELATKIEELKEQILGSEYN